MGVPISLEHDESAPWKPWAFPKTGNVCILGVRGGGIKTSGLEVTWLRVALIPSRTSAWKPTYLFRRAFDFRDLHYLDFSKVYLPIFVNSLDPFGSVSSCRIQSRHAWYSQPANRSARRGPRSFSLSRFPFTRIASPTVLRFPFSERNVTRGPRRTGRIVTTRRIFEPVSGTPMIAADGLLCQPNLPSPRTRMGFGT